MVPSFSWVVDQFLTISNNLNLLGLGLCWLEEWRMREAEGRSEDVPLYNWIPFSSSKITIYQPTFTSLQFVKCRIHSHCQWDWRHLLLQQDGNRIFQTCWYLPDPKMSCQSGLLKIWTNNNIRDWLSVFLTFWLFADSDDSCWFCWCCWLSDFAVTLVDILKTPFQPLSLSAKVISENISCITLILHSCNF